MYIFFFPGSICAYPSVFTTFEYLHTKFRVAILNFYEQQLPIAAPSTVYS